MVTRLGQGGHMSAELNLVHNTETMKTQSVMQVLGVSVEGWPLSVFAANVEFESHDQPH